MALRAARLLVPLAARGSITAASSPSTTGICPSMLTSKRFRICLNNPSPRFKVSYVNGTAPREQANACYHHTTAEISSCCSETMPGSKTCCPGLGAEQRFTKGRADLLHLKSCIL